MAELFRVPATQASKKEVAIKLPFSINQFGVVNFTNNQNQIVADRVRTVLSTAFGERIYRDDFGTNLANDLYNPVGTVADLVVSEVNKAFDVWLTTLTLLEVRVREDEFSGTINVEVDYQLPNLEIDTVEISGIATINDDGTITEVTL